MKRINKNQFIGFLIGLFAVLGTELLSNTEKYVDAFKNGYEMAQKPISE